MSTIRSIVRDVPIRISKLIVSAESCTPAQGGGNGGLATLAGGTGSCLLPNDQRKLLLLCISNAFIRKACQATLHSIVRANFGTDTVEEYCGLSEAPFCRLRKRKGIERMIF